MSKVFEAAAGPQTAADAGRWVHRRIHYDPEVFRAEQERLFRRCWIYVGHESDIPQAGDYLSATVAGEPIVLVRDREGSVNAFFNTCMHRGVRIARMPRGNCGSSFKCMYHGWTYDLKGGCTGVPFFQAYGESFDRRQFDIPNVSVELFHGLIFVAIDPLIPTLTEFLGEVIPDLEAAVKESEVIGRISYMYNGNWKLWHENFADGYHPQFTHYMVKDIEEDYPGQGENTHLRPGHSVLTWDINPPRFDRISKRMSGLTGLEHDVTQSPDYMLPPYPDREQPQTGPVPQNRIFTVFPNIDFQDVVNTVKIEILHPVAPDRTKVEVVELGSVHDTEEQRAWRLRHSGISSHTSAGRIAADDNEAIQFAQQGYAAKKVRYSPISRGQQPGETGGTLDEHGMRGFYAEWMRYMSEPASGLEGNGAGDGSQVRAVGEEV
jgi:phenylpropionate dioxygenase-like ring-hydroxylating dioxygenase large terminal subunit